MSATLVEQGVDSILANATASAPTSMYLANPGEQTLRHVIEWLEPETVDCSCCVLAANDVLKSAMDDFLLASRAADLQDVNALGLRVRNGPPENSVLVTDDCVIALISVNGEIVGLSTDRSRFVERLLGVYADRWDVSAPYRLRTPPLSRVRETLAAELGESALADFDAMLRWNETVSDRTNSLDEVTISLLVAAKNEALLYDISKWGEDVGIASKATFSRTKTDLEERGVIITEKVPIEVGRPRLRLKLGSERLQTSPADEVAAAAVSSFA